MAVSSGTSGSFLWQSANLLIDRRKSVMFRGATKPYKADNEWRAPGALLSRAQSVISMGSCSSQHKAAFDVVIGPLLQQPHMIAECWTFRGNACIVTSL